MGAGSLFGMGNHIHPTAHLVCADAGGNIGGLKDGLMKMGYHVQWYASHAALPLAQLHDAVGWIVLEESGDVVQTLLQAWQNAGCPMPVIIVAPEPHLANAIAAIRGGATDYVPRDLAKIHTALTHADAWAKTRSDAPARAFADVLSRDHLNAPLTKREYEVLIRIGEGKSNKAIAIELGISHRTVETHRSNMMSKMGVHTLAEVLNIYVQTVNTVEQD